MYQFVVSNVPAGCRLNKKTSSYQYKDFHHKDKTIWWLSYLYTGNPHTWKNVFVIIRQDHNGLTWWDARESDERFQAPVHILVLHLTGYEPLCCVILISKRMFAAYDCSINMFVKPGSLVAVVGSVGAGKSTLLSAILGETEKISGLVTVNVSYSPDESL